MDAVCHLCYCLQRKCNYLPKQQRGRPFGSEQQFKNRMILRKAMLAHGFKPLDSEWWHFTLKDEPFPDTYFTFPVRQLTN